MLLLLYSCSANIWCSSAHLKTITVSPIKVARHGKPVSSRRSAVLPSSTQTSSALYTKFRRSAFLPTNSATTSVAFSTTSILLTGPPDYSTLLSTLAWTYPNYPKTQNCPKVQSYQKVRSAHKMFYIRSDLKWGGLEPGTCFGYARALTVATTLAITTLFLVSSKEWKRFG